WSAKERFAVCATTEAGSRATPSRRTRMNAWRRMMRQLTRSRCRRKRRPGQVREQHLGRVTQRELAEAMGLAATRVAGREHAAVVSRAVAEPAPPRQLPDPLGLLAVDPLVAE